MNKTTNEIKVGTPVTICIGSDEYPGTVQGVSPSGHQVMVSHDRARGPGVFTQGERREKFTRRADGRYVQAGRAHTYLHFGVRRHRMDPSF